MKAKIPFLLAQGIFQERNLTLFVVYSAIFGLPVALATAMATSVRRYSPAPAQCSESPALVRMTRGMTGRLADRSKVEVSS